MTKTVQKIIAGVRASLDKTSPGPWTTKSPSTYRVNTAGDIYFIQRWNSISKPDELSANAQHIAACNPANMKALLDSHAALAQAILVLNGSIDDFWNDHGANATEARKHMSEVHKRSITLSQVTSKNVLDIALANGGGGS